MSNIYIITGGSGGIGLECAKRFKDGIVIISGINEEELKSTCEDLNKLGINAKYHIADVSNREKVKDLMDYAKGLGKVKTIVHAAGVSGAISNVIKTLEIDLLGTYNIIEESFEVLEEGSAVILIASMMGHTVKADEKQDELLRNPQKEGNLEKIAELVSNDADEAYNYSKYGVQLLTKYNATRFGGKHARILSISPGVILTPMAKKAMEDHPEQMQYMQSITPLGRNGEPENIADLVEFLASDKASFITGEDILIDGGLTLNIKKEVQK